MDKRMLSMLRPVKHLLWRARRETFHSSDGKERERAFIVSSNEAIYLCNRYWPSPPKNVSFGYKIPINRDAYEPVTDSWETLWELSITTVASRTYGGVTRKVNILDSLWFYPQFGHIENFREAHVWDKATVFSPEKK